MHLMTEGAVRFDPLQSTENHPCRKEYLMAEFVIIFVDNDSGMRRICSSIIFKKISVASNYAIKITHGPFEIMELKEIDENTNG